MKNILVPTDFSACSEYAVEVGAQLARQNGTTLYLLHALEIPFHDSSTNLQEYQSIPEGLFLMKLAQKKFAELLKKPFLQGVKIVEAIVFDYTLDSIHKSVDKYGIDLIVMGATGEGATRRGANASNTRKVLRDAPCPVLTVKHRIENFHIDHVTFASNFFGEVEYSFEKITNYLQEFDPTYHLLKVITPANFEPSTRSIKIMQDFANKFDIAKCTYNTFNEITVEKGVVEFSEQRKVDVIVMPTHGRKGLSHMLHGSLVENLVTEFDVPILSYKIEVPEPQYGVLFPA